METHLAAVSVAVTAIVVSTFLEDIVVVCDSGLVLGLLGVTVLENEWLDQKHPLRHRADM